MTCSSGEMRTELSRQGLVQASISMEFPWNIHGMTGASDEGSRACWVGRSEPTRWVRSSRCEDRFRKRDAVGEVVTRTGSVPGEHRVSADGRRAAQDTGPSERGAAGLATDRGLATATRTGAERAAVQAPETGRSM